MCMQISRITRAGAFCRLLSAGVLSAGMMLAGPARGAGFEGRVVDESGAPIPGAMVTARFHTPFQERTVFTDDAGRYRLDALPAGVDHTLRVRRVGWHDVRSGGHVPGEVDAPTTLDFSMVRHTDPAAVAEQLPANRWYELVLERLETEHDREQFVRQCTFCHQQGNPATRLQRDEAEWHKVFALMARMGAGLDEDLRNRMPAILNSAYDPETAIPALTRGWQEPGFAPPPPAEVRRAVIDEYQLGGRSSMQHDMIVHPSGQIYSVDMTTDTLFRLDPSVPGGRREWFSIPREDLTIGGVMGSGALPANTEMYVGPHSLQVDHDGAIWITLATGNRLAKFDPQDNSFSVLPLPGGIYPHTLRIDGRNRVWYTVAGSNHVGMYDPASGEHVNIRVPARSFGEAVMLRLIPFFMWLGQYVDLSGASGAGSGEGGGPVPYGIDIAPNGDVWFSQLNAHRIGVIDPETYEVRMIDTPFAAPRRMRFDSKGNLWIPGFSSNVLARFDIETEQFELFEIPIEPIGTETPYALNVDRSSDTVWICGTNSDTLMSFDPATEQFTIYPMPTRVTYTREIDFGEDGSIWTTNSNIPAWQIETGIPRVVRLMPSPPMRTAAVEPVTTGGE